MNALQRFALALILLIILMLAGCDNDTALLWVRRSLIRQAVR